MPTFKTIFTPMKIMYFHARSYLSFGSPTNVVNQNISQVQTSTTNSLMICIALFTLSAMGKVEKKKASKSVLITSASKI